MVYIKQIDLTNFKSFGGTTHVPLTPEFTVVSGPNGSGKSNILDALLFCLGISSSKGMRADRLPDLVNQNQASRKGTVEASVTVTFDLTSEFPLAPDGTPANVVDAAAIAEIGQGADEWSVTRRLRVTQSGSYTSTYYINGEVATQGELHEKLSQLRIYPEGYNVVLQGDVTSIISMNLRERREIIDELAGVAAFDRKIEQAKRKFEAVQEREDQCRIVERELVAQRDKLAADRIKAEKYQALKADYVAQQTWERVLQWQQVRSQLVRVREQIEAGDRERIQLKEQLASVAERIAHDRAELDQLNAQVKALGEDEAIELQTRLARSEADHERITQRCQELETAIAEADTQIQQIQAEIERNQVQLATFAPQQTQLEAEIDRRQILRAEAAANLEQQRETASESATTAEAWVREQMQLRHQADELQAQIAPQQAERAQIQERLSQADRQFAELDTSRDRLTVDLSTARRQRATIAREREAAQQACQQLETDAHQAERDLQVQQETRSRLLEEQRDKQRRLDQLEARAQVMQEASGSHTTQLLRKSGIEGICGLVAQLGRVESEFRVALETAAGGRLGHWVVEDDLVAATAIRLLKERRAGRATFLPLNKIRSPQIILPPEIKQTPGFIDLALDLMDCDPRYDDIFAYVFGSTVVFDSL
ncbi:MAG: chromosome segregation protein SMC, partial [Oscillatoriales cyanobacterium]